jgi:hypothetical protein
MEWEAHNRLCKNRQIKRILAYVDAQSDSVEKSVIYITSFNMLDQYHHTDLAIEIGYRYLFTFTENQNWIILKIIPDTHVCKRMAILYDQIGHYDLGIWVCDLAMYFGIDDDGTKAGFSGRKQKLLKRQAEQGAAANP